MRHFLILSILCITVLRLQAQVGIGTTNPNATSILDITATDKGVLVPRINLTDVSNLTTPINTPATGLLIWNTNASVTGGNGIGFYFFNGSQWMPIMQIQVDDADFYEEGTTSAPDDINDDIFTQGNLAIGKTIASYNLDIYEHIGTRTISLDNYATSGVISGVYNHIGGNMTTIQAQRGIYNEISGTGNNWKYGVYNNITGTGNTSNRYGTFNTLVNNSLTSDYGTYNNITSSSTSNHGKYGTYNSINNSDASTNYGVYNVINGSSTRPQTGTFNWIINSSPANNLSSFGTRNILRLSGSGPQYGTSNEFNAASGGGIKTGVFNVMDSPNDAPRYGIDNYFNGTGNGNHVGVFNRLQGTGTGTKSGTHTYIPNSAGGTHFGLYSHVLKSGSYSGFFIGNVAIGTQPHGVASPDYYIFPASRGTSNQVMQTDGSGNLSWVDPSSLLIQKINDLSDGKSDDDGSENGSSIFLGINAGLVDDGSDNYNVGIGFESLQANTSGNKNIATGYQSLYSNTFGYSNIASGYQSLYNNTTGFGNVAIGNRSHYNNTMGAYNISLGYQTFFSNTIGSNNIAIGYQAINSNTEGNSNVGLGHRTLHTNITGDNNVALGYNSGYSSLGNASVFLGYHSGYFETASNRLYIENSNADANSALIYGEFDNNILRVNGELQLGSTSSDRYVFPTTDGSSNQILSTNGSGQLSWQDLPSSSFWSRSGTNLDVATAADDINFSSDQTSITFPITTGTPSSMIYMFNGGFSNSNRMVFSHSTGYDDWGLQYRDHNDSFHFLAGGADRVTINLGAGNPLVVNGSAEATNFISSTTTYPDYVFEAYFDGTSTLNENYSFRSLEDVEAYIIQHGHLPGVQSYNEVEENDMTIDLTETSIVNLEKIEELFLYSIQLKKENKKLKEHQNTLEKRLEKIESLLSDDN